jgi:hypothetical protein
MNKLLTNRLSKHCLGLESYLPAATILPRQFDMNVSGNNWGKRFG